MLRKGEIVLFREVLPDGVILEDGRMIPNEFRAFAPTLITTDFKMSKNRPSDLLCLAETLTDEIWIRLRQFRFAKRLAVVANDPDRRRWHSPPPWPKRCPPSGRRRSTSYSARWTNLVMGFFLLEKLGRHGTCPSRFRYYLVDKKGSRMSLKTSQNRSHYRQRASQCSRRPTRSGPSGAKRGMWVKKRTCKE